jgi:hypothetical protein
MTDPDPSGIARSVFTSVGLVLCTIRTPSAPVLASPTTPEVGFQLDQRAQPVAQDRLILDEHYACEPHCEHHRQALQALPPHCLETVRGASSPAMNQAVKSTVFCAELLADLVQPTRAAPCATDRETAASIASNSSQALPSSDAQRSATALRVKPVNAARVARLKAQYRIRNSLMQHYDQTRCVTDTELSVERPRKTEATRGLVQGARPPFLLSAPLVIRPC